MKLGISGWRLADGGWESKEARGDRKPDRMLRESFQVAGGGDRWRVAGGNEGWSAPAASFRRLMDGTSIPSSIQSSAIDAAIASVAVTMS
jgi:hypothetical protein